MFAEKLRYKLYEPEMVSFGLVSVPEEMITYLSALLAKFMYIVED